MPTATEIEPLTAQDRCDRCGARAVYRTRIAGVGDLLWCNHDYSKRREALEQYEVEGPFQSADAEGQQQ